MVTFSSSFAKPISASGVGFQRVKIERAPALSTRWKGVPERGCLTVEAWGKEAANV
jgi:hypothetical protein